LTGFLAGIPLLPISLIFMTVFLLGLVTAGALIGAGLTGFCTMPVPTAWWVRLGLAIAGNMGTMGAGAWILRTTRDNAARDEAFFLWLILIGVAAGTGFFWGLNPGFLDKKEKGAFQMG